MRVKLTQIRYEDDLVLSTVGWRISSRALIITVSDHPR